MGPLDIVLDVRNTAATMSQMCCGPVSCLDPQFGRVIIVDSAALPALKLELELCFDFSAGARL